MLGSRRNRPSLIGRAAHTAARTALIAGTATAVSGSVARKQAGAAAAAAPGAEPVPQAAPVEMAQVEAAPAAPSALTPEQIAQLRELADLRAQGILTDAEFEAQKARLLG